MRSPLLLATCLIGLSVFDSTRVDAGLPEPESSRLPYTVDQSAAMLVARSNLIVEATVLDLKPIPVVQGMGCRWMSEIWLQPTRQLWGVIDDPKFKIITEGVSPDQEGDLPPGCRVAHNSEEEPPPAVGESGIFLLSTGSWQLVEGERTLNLPSVSMGFLPKRQDGNASVSIRTLRYMWPYEEIVSAIERRASSLSIESLMSLADAIFVGTGTLRGALWTVDVENVYRGHVDDPFSILFPFDAIGSDPELATQAMLVSELAWRLQQRTGNRFLIFARKQGNSWLPVDHGVLTVVGGNRVQVQARLHEGKVGWSESILSDIEPILRGNLKAARSKAPADRKE